MERPPQMNQEVNPSKLVELTLVNSTYQVGVSRG